MKLQFTRKTWYFLLLAACAVSMANGFAVLAGMDFSFLEMVAFCATALSVLFFAADKGADTKEKQRYFGVFLVLLASYLLPGGAGYAASALAWPLLLLAEEKRGAAVALQLRLVTFAEAAHLALVLLVSYGGFTVLAFYANLFWVLLGVARGWAALVLYKNGPAEN